MIVRGRLHALRTCRLYRRTRDVTSQTHARQLLMLFLIYTYTFETVIIGKARVSCYELLYPSLCITIGYPRLVKLLPDSLVNHRAIAKTLEPSISWKLLCPSPENPGTPKRGASCIKRKPSHPKRCSVLPHKLSSNTAPGHLQIS